MPLYSTTITGVPNPTEKRYGLIQYQGTKIYYSGNLDSNDMTAANISEISNDAKDEVTQATKITLSTGVLGSNKYCGFFSSSGFVDMRHNPSFEVDVKTPAVIDASKWVSHNFGFQDTANENPGKQLNFTINAFTGTLNLIALDTSVNNFGVNSSFGTFAANTWYKLKFRVDSSIKAIYGSVDGGPEEILDCSGSATSNLFTQALRLSIYTRWQGNGNTMEITLGSAYYEFNAR